MLATIFLALAAPSAPVSEPLTPAAALQEAEIDVEKRIAEAGDDVEKLAALAAECKENGLRKEMRQVYRRLLEVDPDHEAAHKALGHHFYDEQWFESYTALATYKRAEDKRMLDKGLVRFGDDWAPKEDVPFLRMGWVKGDGGVWVSKPKAERLLQEAQYKEEGWKQQDLTWIHPDDFPKWTEGLWKCGEDWLSLEEADAYHSEIGRWWQIPGDHFVALSTLDRESSRWAAWYADQTYADLVRIFGLQPKGKTHFVTLNSTEQYNLFAAGAQGATPATDAEGNSSIHYAYFADVWVDPSVQPPEYLGTGVSYWEQGNEGLAPYGQHSIRHAAAHAYVEAIDPSWNAISELLAAGSNFAPGPFWEEKRIPKWLRYGAASYVERFFRDPNVGEDGNPWWARDWAMENVRAKGGLRPLEEIFAFSISVNDIEGSGKLIHEAGCLVSFLIDGDCAPAKQAHAAFKAALHSGESTDEAVEALQKALVDNQDQLKGFARL